MTLTLSAPDVDERDIEAVVSVLRSNRLSLGPWMERFEGAVATYTSVPHAVAVSSGTAGLHLALLALNIGPGDEVIVPSFAFIAAANAIRYVGAVPVFADVDADSLNLDPASVRAALTPRTRALMVVHTFGRVAAMPELLAIAAQHGLRVIEDACEALGATLHGQQAGSFGDVAVFAFYPNKQITTGEGGMIVTRDGDLARVLRALRNQGRFESDSWHQHSLLGYNYRLSEMQCALGTTQMERLPDILRQRAAVAAAYDPALEDEARLERPPVVDTSLRTGVSRSWFVYVVRLHLAPHIATRDTVAKRLANAGVPTGRYFAPIHQQPAYAAFQPRVPLPVTERESTRTLALPFHTRLGRDEVCFVAEALRLALNTESAP